MNEPRSGSSYRDTPALRRSRAQLAALMRTRREFFSYTVKFLAGEVGVSSKTYRGWEDGSRSVHAEYLPVIAAALCVPVRDLADALIDRSGAASAAASTKTSAASVAA